QPDHRASLVHVAPAVAIENAGEFAVEIPRIVELRGDGKGADEIDETPSAVSLGCRQTVGEPSRDVIEPGLDDEHSSAIDEAPLPTDPDGRPIAGVAPSDFIEPRRDGHRAGFVNKAPKAFRLHGSQPSTEPISVFELWLDDE